MTVDSITAFVIGGLMTSNSKRNQRIGQWLYNHFMDEHQGKGCESLDGMYERIANRIWNMSDTEFYQLLKLKEKEEYKPIEICDKHHRVLDDNKKCRDCECQ